MRWPCVTWQIALGQPSHLAIHKVPKHRQFINQRIRKSLEVMCIKDRSRRLLRQSIENINALAEFMADYRSGMYSSNFLTVSVVPKVVLHLIYVNMSSAELNYLYCKLAQHTCLKFMQDLWALYVNETAFPGASKSDIYVSSRLIFKLKYITGHCKAPIRESMADLPISISQEQY